jgi:tetratricopeptide (TPR) repeat protein
MASAAYDRGLVAAEKGDYQTAIADYSEAIRLKPNFAEALVNRGLNYDELRQHDKAIADFSEVSRLKPYSATGFYVRGVAYYALKQYDKAVADFSEAIRLRPDNAEAHKNRADAYYHLGKWYKAIVGYNEAIRLKPDYAEAYKNRADAYDWEMEHEKAIADYTEVIRLRPDSAEAYKNRAEAYVSLKQYEKAIADFSEAIRLKPDFAEAFNNRGTAYGALGRHDKPSPTSPKGSASNPTSLMCIVTEPLVTTRLARKLRLNAIGQKPTALKRAVHRRQLPQHLSFQMKRPAQRSIAATPLSEKATTRKLLPSIPRRSASNPITPTLSTIAATSTPTSNGTSRRSMTIRTTFGSDPMILTAITIVQLAMKSSATPRPPNAIAPERNN